ncbi:MAG: response regulator transcription factor [Chloroflexi bacterium]|nr:response regulator transcription factor [Chloroflexota bacterium]
MITVLLADDGQVVRAGLRRLLEQAQDVQVIGEATDRWEVVRQTDLLRPHVVLLGIAMPVHDRMEAARQVKEQHPSTGVVLLMMHESEAYLLDSLRCGAEGYVPVSAPAAEVIEAIRRAARGEVYLNPSAARFLLQNLLKSTTREEVRDVYERLSKREREVLVLVGQGLTSRQIAERLRLSPSTVHRHRSTLMRKLGLHDRLGLLRFCIRRGLVDPQQPCPEELSPSRSS